MNLFMEYLLHVARRCVDNFVLLCNFCNFFNGTDCEQSKLKEDD